MRCLVIVGFISSFVVVTQAIAQEPAPVAPGTAPGPAPAPAAASAEKVKILVMDIAAAGLDAATVENITGLSAVILADDRRLDVLSGADVKRMAELEGEKQALGCTNDASCLAEVAGAMGAGLVVYGNGGKLGTLLNINLNLFDAAQARSVGRVAVQAKSLEELPEKLRPALAQLVAAALGTPSTYVEAPPVEKGPNMLPWIAIGGGAVVAVGGGIALVVGIGPAGDIAAAEDAFKSAPDATGRQAALTQAQAVRADWYDNGLAPGLVIGGTVGALVGLGLVGVGVALMGGGE